MRRLFERFLPSRNNDGGSKDSKVVVGIAAMDKKAKSKQMNQILQRLKAYGEFNIIIYGDETILHKPIEEWPKCDCLLSWHSDGFPLEKAQEYAKLRGPFCVNDLPQQHSLLDRTQVYRTLVAHQIPVPKHIIVERNGLQPGEDPEGFIETEDYVEQKGVRIIKPFVEKPEYAEDHNIHIYYPHSMGGGVKRLFRKVNDKSSHYDSRHSGAVRRDGNYIYEEFLATGGTDVKVYTVGPRYAHAEARKSPVVDGKVLRTADGKEMRFPVLLTPQEKEVARQVVMAFNQNVCGFDLLRSEKGKSFVCDVNGWSFVKNSKRYYDDSAGILRSMILGAVAPQHLAAMPTPDVTFSTINSSLHKPSQNHLYGLEQDDAALLMDADEPDEGLEGELAACIDDAEIARTDQRSENDELRCVLAVIRHGDRTPKQKLKLHTTAEPLLALFHKFKDAKGKQAKLKSPGQLQELLNVTRQLLHSWERPQEESQQARSQAQHQDPKRSSISSQDAAASNGPANAAAAAAAAASAAAGPTAPLDPAAGEDANAELREKLRIVRTVLEQASFNGINRKVQIKPTKWRTVTPQPETSGGAGSGSTEAGATSKQVNAAEDKNTSQAHDTKDTKESSKEHKDQQQQQQQPLQQLEEVLIVCKWGGVLTHAGRLQAEDLGKVFRLVMYPRYGSAGGGLLRLHSTYRHDLKIYSSDEGRVQASAAAFAKGLLDLEGTSLTPILVSLVKKDASMLDAFGKGASEDIQRAKDAVYRAMTHDPERHATTQNTNSSAAVTPLGTSPPSPSRALSPLGNLLQDGQQQQQQQQEEAMAGVNSSGDTATPFASTQAGSEGADKGRYSAKPLDIQVPQPGEGMAGPDTEPGVDGSSPQPTPHSSPNQEPIPCIKNMPEQPLALLRRLVELMKVLVGQLRELCLHEKVEPGAHTGGAGIGARYSSLSHEPRTEWQLEPGKPCSGERMLLMFDRWRKLLKSFYSEKKGTFDISKIPDIYDSAKYDANHNDHLNLDLRELYIVSRQLAIAVIPNEYGIDAQGKLHIGSRIATELLGKLLVDLDAMREESVNTVRQEEAEERQRIKESVANRAGGTPNARLAGSLRRHSIPGHNITPPAKRESTAGQGATTSRLSLSAQKDSVSDPPSTPLPGAPDAGIRTYGGSGFQGTLIAEGSKEAAGTAGSGGGAQGGGKDEGKAGVKAPGVDDANKEGAEAKSQKKAEGAEDSDDAQGEDKEGDSDQEVEVEETIHRLCPDYARETINSPLRHVRTRIYFTSESHIHSLVNVLRLCHLTHLQDQQPHLSQYPTCPEPVSVAGSSESSQQQQQQQEQQKEDLLQHRQHEAHTPGCCGAPLLSPEACAMLDNTPELDYLTHVVFRMYENKAVPVTAPERFRVEILFSPGAVGNPFQVAAERSRVASLSTKLSKELAQGSDPAAEQQQQGAGAGFDIPDKTSGGEEWPNGSTKCSTADPTEAHTGAPGGKGAGSKGAKKEGEKEDKREDGRVGSRASMEGLSPQPQPQPQQQQQQQQQFEYVSVSRLNSTSSSVKLKSKPSSNVDEGEAASGRFGRLSNCSAGKGGSREEPGSAELESSRPSQQPSATNSPRVKSKPGSVVDEGEAGSKQGKGKNSSSKVSSRRVSNTGGGDDSEGEGTYGSGGGGGGKNKSSSSQHCCRGPAWHVLPVAPRTVLHDGHKDGIALEALEQAVGPMAKVHKFAPPAYTAALHARIHGPPVERPGGSAPLL